MSHKTKAELLEEVNRLQGRVMELEISADRETLYRNSIASAHGVSYQLDFESNSYTHLDEQIEGLLGYGVSEVSPKIWPRICKQAVLRSELGDLSFDEAKKAFRGGDMSVWQADYLATTKSGRARWLSDSSMPIRDEHGDVTGCLGILLDITERWQAEQSLRQAHDDLERRTAELVAVNNQLRHNVQQRECAEEESRQSAAEFRLLADNVPAMFSYVGAGGCLRFVNRRYEEWFGIPAAQIVGKHYREIVGESAAEKIEVHVKAALSGEHVEYEIEMPHRRGGTRYVHVVYVPDEVDGEVRGYLSLVTDITKRYRAETELSEFKAVLDQTLDCVFMFDPETLRFFYVNRGAMEQVGYSEDELLRMTPLDIKPEFDRASFCEMLEPLIDGSIKVQRFEIVHRHKEGHDVPVEVALQYISPSGGPFRFVAIVRDIAERKLAEQSSREKQAQLDDLLSNIDAIILEGDPFDIYYVGGQVEKILGYPKEMWFEHPGGPVGFWSGLLHPDDLDKAELCRQAIERGENHFFEYRLIARDGKPIWFYDSVMVESRDGMPEKTRAVMIDITDRKAAEAELRESEERYRRLAELMPAAMYACDAVGRITYFNEPAAALWGQTPEIGDPDRRFCGSFRLYLPDGSLLPHNKTPMAAALNEGRSFRNQEVTIERPDGSRTTVLANVDPIHDASGTRTGAITVFFDVTELRRAEEALRRSEERLDLAVRGTSDGLWDWDIETGTEYWSPRFKELLGYREDEIEATFDQYIALLHPEDKADVLEAVRLHLEENRSYDREFRLRTKCGDYRWFRSRGEALRDENGRPYRVAGSMRDITDRRLAQEEIRELQEKLAHVARLSTMGEMATGLAHELNQPLSAISAYCYAGQQIVTDVGPTDQEQLWDLFDKLTEQAMRAGEIIRRLRGLVAKRTPVRSSVDSGELIEGLLRLMEPDLRESEVRLERRLDHLEPAVTIDEVQIQQVLVNLIRNALDAMSETRRDQRTLTITTSQMAGDLLEVAVCDTGRGIPVESSYQVFDAFFSSKSEGMGMGLAISRTIIESHGGHLWMTPNSGRGVTFRFTVPLEKDESHDNGN